MQYTALTPSIQVFFPFCIGTALVGDADFEYPYPHLTHLGCDLRVDCKAILFYLQFIDNLSGKTL